MIAVRRIHGPPDQAARWCRDWQQAWPEAEVLLLLAATDTAAVPGISAAGATAESRLGTAAADAELMLFGPRGARVHGLPPLPAGVSPALISHVVLAELGLRSLVIDLGCRVAPSLPHLRLPGVAGAGPARCLSSGEALDPQRVRALLDWGRRLTAGPGQGTAARRPLLMAECVPGGTSTALAVLRGLGVDADGLVSGSLLRPAHQRKAALVEQGLAAAGLTAAGGADPAALDADDGVLVERVLAAVADPMQPLAAALCLTAAAAERPVLLAGGSQMAAVLALALDLAPPALRPRIASHAAVATTRWVAAERDSDLALLLQRIGERWQVQPLAFAADLCFGAGCHPALLDYERGYVKEGVGAGGLALLWQLSGRDAGSLAVACDQACRQLLPV